MTKTKIQVYLSLNQEKKNDKLSEEFTAPKITTNTLKTGHCHKQWPKCVVVRCDPGSITPKKGCQTKVGCPDNIYIVGILSEP